MKIATITHAEFEGLGLGQSDLTDHPYVQDEQSMLAHDFDSIHSKMSDILERWIVAVFNLI